jgi:hypothetical protein
VGGFNWSISRIDAGGLDSSLAVVGACFPWAVFVLVHPCAAKEVQDRNRVQGGGGAGFFAAIRMLFGHARDKIHIVEGTWVLTI